MQRRMLARAAGLAFAAAGLFLAAPTLAAPAPLPAGSYQQSCRNIAVTGTTLEAECKTRSGFWTNAQLGDYRGCTGDIANNDGVLACGENRSDRGRNQRGADAGENPGGSRRSHAADNERERGEGNDADDRDHGASGDSYFGSYPRGSYRDTCRNIHRDGEELIAECRTWDGEWHRTKLRDYQGCGEHIVNDDGRLRCAGGGSNAGGDHGRNADWRPRGSYQDSCRNIRLERGDLIAECRARFGWKASTLDNARSCRGDIANDNGRLVCTGGGGKTLTLYRDARFHGEQRDISSDVPDLGDFADRASSATVRDGSWQLCTRRNFGGRCVTINDSVGDFFDIGLNDRVESIRRIR